MSAGHTPGPLLAIRHLEEGDEHRCGVVAVRGDLQYLVAIIENGAPGDFCDTEWANACLFAAAPHMLDALRRISTLRPAGDVATATGTRALVQQIEAIALNAIARATGEQP